MDFAKNVDKKRVGSILRIFYRLILDPNLSTEWTASGLLLSVYGFIYYPGDQTI